MIEPARAQHGAQVEVVGAVRVQLQEIDGVDEVALDEGTRQ